MGRWWKQSLIIGTVVMVTMLLMSGAALAGPTPSGTDGAIGTGDAIQTGVGLILFAATAKAMLGFLKVLRNRLWGSVLTTLTWWVAGIVLVVVFAQTKWADGISLWEEPLGRAGWWELIVLGIVGPGSLGINWNEGMKARDDSQTAQQPPLFFEPSSPPPMAIDESAYIADDNEFEAAMDVGDESVEWASEDGPEG